jgi:hypothetical protein
MHNRTKMMVGPTSVLVCNRHCGGVSQYSKMGRHDVRIEGLAVDAGRRLPHGDGTWMFCILWRCRECSDACTIVQ